MTDTQDFDNIAELYTHMYGQSHASTGIALMGIALTGIALTDIALVGIAMKKFKLQKIEIIFYDGNNSL